MPSRDININIHERRDNPRAMVEAARDLEAYSRGVEATSHDTKTLTHDTHSLNAEIKKTEERIKDLGRQFMVSGDRSLFVDIRKERSHLAQLERLAKGVAEDVGDTFGRTTTKGLVDSIQGLPSLSRGALIGAAVGMGALMSPAIGAIISGAVVGGVGLGGVVGGVIAASKDQRVVDAFRDLGGRFNSSALHFDAFVEPTVRGIAEIKSAVDDMHIGETFEKAAPFIETVAKGIGDLGRNLMPGLDHALENAGPEIAVIAQGLGDTGQALGDMVRDMSDSKGAAEGLHYAFRLLDGGIHVLGDSLSELGNAFDFLVNKGATVSGNAEDLFGVLQYGNPVLAASAWAMRTVNDDLEEMAGHGKVVKGALFSAAQDGVYPFADAARDAHEKTQALNVTLQTLFENSLGISNATIAYEQALDDLTQSVKDNGKSLDTNEQKGRNNMRAINEAIADAIRARDQLAEKKGITEANAEYDKMIQRIIAVGVKAGLSRQALEDLVGKYEVDLFFNITSKGDAHVRYDNLYLGGDIAPKHHAAGTASAPPGWSWVGEAGPELMKFKGGERVLSNPDSQRWMNSMSQGSQTTVVLDIRGGDDDLKRLLRKWVRIEGGGSVQTAFGN